MNYIGENLKYLINTFFNGSRQDFCKKYECNEVQLSRYINNNQSPKFDWLYRISKDYGFTLNDMYDSDFTVSFDKKPSVNDDDFNGGNNELLKRLHEENLYFESMHKKIFDKCESISSTLDVVVRSNAKILLDNADYEIKFNKLLDKIDSLTQKKQD